MAVAIVDAVQVPLTEKEAHRMADMFGVLSDLRIVIQLCQAILRRIGPQADFLELEALQAAALIRYGRTYTSGARLAFSVSKEWIDQLPPHLQLAHHQFHALRDKHIAHSVNDWEVYTPIAQLNVDLGTNERTVSGVTVQWHRVVSMNEDAIQTLQQLATTLEQMLQIEFEAECKRVLEMARNISRVEIDKRMKIRPRSPGQGSLVRRRAR